MAEKAHGELAGPGNLPGGLGRSVGRSIIYTHSDIAARALGKPPKRIGASPGSPIWRVFD